jgi:hypothetical protein
LQINSLSRSVDSLLNYRLDQKQENCNTNNTTVNTQITVKRNETAPKTSVITAENNYQVVKNQINAMTNYKENIKLLHNSSTKIIPSECIVINPCKLKLEASSSLNSEEENIFQSNPENQYQVFLNYMQNKVSDEEFINLKNQITKATSHLDLLNGQEGYRGTSIESVAYLEGSTAYLELINEKMIPDTLKKGFKELIDEYHYFNSTSREKIADKMTLGFTIVGVQANGKPIYEYSESMIAKRKEEFKKESTFFKEKYALLKDDTNDKKSIDKVMHDISLHLYEAYGRKYERARDSDKIIKTSHDNTIENIMDLWNNGFTLYEKQNFS